MTRDELLSKYKEPIKVGDKGHVLLVDVMGGDQDIVDAARISYGKGTVRVNEDRNLIRYLMRHKHTSPFEMCELKIRIRIPIDAWRQMVRHRTASINEYSTRYSEAIDDRQETDRNAWRLQATDNKQGSSGYLEEWPEGFTFFPFMEACEVPVEEILASPPGRYLSVREKAFHIEARELYEERLALGIAKEQARKDLPLSTYTEAYWKCDLRNLLHFLSLRLDKHAQLEIREFAEAISQIVKDWCPITWEAFEDYVLNAMTLSGQEVMWLQMMFDEGFDQGILPNSLQVNGKHTREAKEFFAKMFTLTNDEVWNR